MRRPGGGRTSRTPTTLREEVPAAAVKIEDEVPAVEEVPCVVQVDNPPKRGRGRPLKQEIPTPAAPADSSFLERVQRCDTLDTLNRCGPILTELFAAYELERRRFMPTTRSAGKVTNSAPAPAPASLNQEALDEIKKTTKKTAEDMFSRLSSVMDNDGIHLIKAFHTYDVEKKALLSAQKAYEDFKGHLLQKSMLECGWKHTF